MVIFGAGASYDSVPSRPPSDYPRLEARLPLASELFSERDEVRDALSRFPQCRPIVPYLRSPPAGVTIEQTLETLQSEAETDPERTRQLAAVRFYLHYVIWECERSWDGVARGITNYVTLFDQLRRSRRPEETVCLVTFNYDRMIENALDSVGLTIDSIPDYISQDTFKLFKLHGSVHWGREVNTPVVATEDRNVWEVGRELIERAEELDISTRFRMVQEHPIGKLGDVALFPAIAIPVETKRSYECPDDHLTSLQEHVPKITKILIVGWRAAEQHFLSLLKEFLSQEVPAYVVAGDKQSALEVISRIQQAGVSMDARPAEGGFTDFTVSREAEKFLSS